MAKKATKPAKKAPVKAAARKKAVKRETGRPSLYSDKMVAAICGWIIQGYTLRQISELPNMPDKSTIIRWLGDHEDFRDQYARAREIQAMLMEDEILEIAEDSRNDWVEREGKDGKTELVFNDELVKRARLRIDARKWLMGKMAPKRYGERVAVTGKDGGAVKHEHAIASVLDEIDGEGTGIRHGRGAT
ncbi:terminase small subunit protein [Dyella sp.]|jgi:hypothetical protein|uniref:terminase small subunit-like protein n=1 Tax=Dyella sp. TaxID=1869338 RepID=UPI002FD9BCCA